MVKKILFVLIGTGIIMFYLTSSWFGWEFANSGRKSYFHMPFFYGGGYRGGK